MIKLHELSFSFENQKQGLLQGISTGLHPGWTSICGPNGCGKTTLMKLIAGELKPRSGSIELHGTVISVPQSTEQPPTGLNDFASDFGRDAVQLREGLGIGDDWCERWPSLSIGERKRLQVGVALARRPDVLLVDEPTNHVDEPTKAVLLEEFRRFRGVGLLISHDRLLLNELCTTTAFVEAQTLVIFSAGYDEARAGLKESRQLAKSQREAVKGSLARAERSVQQQGEKVAGGKNKLSKRGIAKKDRDAKEKIDRAKVSGADKADSRKKKILERKAERLAQELTGHKVHKEYNLGVFFAPMKRLKTVVFDERILRFDYLTLECPEVALSPGDKLAITGANGAGKSTLLKNWVHEFRYPFTYGPQEFSQMETKRLAKELAALESDVRGKVMTLVSRFGSSPKSIAAGSAPSPGVWQKIVIARAIVGASPYLVLDEPTNHMDLPAVEILEEALTKYEGTVICISHDRAFVEAVCNRRLHLEKDGGRTIATLSYIR